jgi:hypothetical protein
MKIITENDNNFGHEKIMIVVDNIPLKQTWPLYWLTGFRGEDFKTFFPIGSYVKTTVCPLKASILDGGQGHRTQF